jgi:uncharacterized protein with HEPN domain
MQFMPSEDPAVRFDDILKNIQRIRKHTSDMVRDEFLLDEKSIDAVERCFERIAEASRKLGNRYDSSYPELKLAGLRGFGNVLRHDYGDVRPELLWKFIQERLLPLEAMARAELAKLEN